MIKEIKYFKRYSIGTKIMFFFIVLAGLLFIIVGLLFYRSTNNAIHTSKNSEMSTIAYQTSNEIERFMFERYGDIRVMADSPLLRGMNIKRELRFDYLESVRNAYETYDFILTTDSRDKVNIISGKLKGDNIYKSYVEEVLKGGILVSDFIFNKKNGEIVVYFGAPIKNQMGRITGSVIARMNFNTLSEIVTKVRVGKSGRAFLFGKDENFILKPKELNNIYKLKLPKDKEDLTAENLTNNNKRFICVLYPIKKYITQNNLWYLVVEEPYNEAYKVGIGIRDYTILIILVGIIALFVLGTILSKIITKPIKRLLEETKKVIKNNGKRNEEKEGRDEIGHLTSSINSIINSLKAMMQQILEISGEAASLEDIRQYAESFFESIPSAIMAIDNGGIITNFNEAAEVITGIRKEDILEKRMDDFNGTGIITLVEGLKFGLEHSKTLKRQIIKVKNKKLEDISIMLTTSIQRDDGDNIIGVIGVFKIAEEINRFEASIIRARNLASLGTLSAGMAHEIRNPLTSIKGYAQYVLGELKENDELSSDISIIINEVDRLEDILERFLRFARPEQLNLKPTNINKTIGTVIKLISREIRENGIVLIEELQEIPEIGGDEEQLQQAFLNIMLNSIQAVEGNGELRISTKASENLEFVQLSIRDNGMGIKTEELDNIFDPFYTTKERGTGLGLAISMQIIEKHRGFIQVESNVGIGTEFIIGLPIKDKE